MPADDLVRSRASLVIGAGQTTRKNRVLPAAIVDPQIPPRIGVAPVRLPKTKASAIWHRGFTTVEIAGTMPPRRFDPYTLGTLDFPYGIGVVGYDVTTWASGWNVIDQLPWYDVVCFWNGKILINAAELADLQIPSATLAAPAMPYAIPYQAGSEWGNQTINQVEKRVFAIGRSHVQAFNVGGTLAILSPAQPRADGKAMTIGQRIDRAQHKAWLGQIYYTGYSWDSPGGTWQFSSSEVAMLLVTPFLQQTAGSANVDMPRADLSGSGSPSQISQTIPVVLPQMPVATVGVAEIGHVGTYPSDLSYPGWSVVWPHRSLYYAAPNGNDRRSGAALSWSATSTDTSLQAGRSITYAQSNAKTFDDYYSEIDLLSQDIDLPPGSYPPGGRSSYSLGCRNGNELYWDPGDVGTFPRGTDVAMIYGGLIGNSRVHQLREVQNLTSTIDSGSRRLVDLTIAISKVSGQSRSLTPRLDDWQVLLNNPYGALAITAFLALPQNGYAPLVAYKNPSWQLADQPADAIAEINAEFAARQASYLPVLHYADPGYNRFPYRYYCSISTAPDTLTSSLAWTTRDWLFLDETNGVEILIESTFAGSQTGAIANATLTVALEIKTRYHTLKQQLLQRQYVYASLLPEAPIPFVSGRTAVPSPQIRAVWAPLYQEQGAFKGASYITAAEEIANSTPAHLFNFQLRLHNLADLGQINGLNLSTDVVHFCPINLCEMLYAFVFSQDYGIGRTTAQRYPVTDSTKYNDLMNTLFSDVYPVLVRDGVFGAWATSLNGNSAGLYRT